jgi:hypothetical protein
VIYLATSFFVGGRARGGTPIVRMKCCALSTANSCPLRSVYSSLHGDSRRDTRRYAKHDIPRPFRAAAHHLRGARRRVTTRDSEDLSGMKFLKYEILLGRVLLCQINADISLILRVMTMYGENILTAEEGAGECTAHKARPCTKTSAQ